MKLRIITALLFCIAGEAAESRAATTNAAPDFKEVYQLLRSNLAGASEMELNRAAVQGLLSQVQPRAALVGEPRQTNLVASAEQAIRTGIFDASYGYLRVTRFGQGTDKQVLSAFQQLISS